MEDLKFNFGEIETNEASKGGDYISHGVHKVRIKSVEHKALAGANYTGDAWDVTFITEDNKTTSGRFFPFKFNPTLTKYVKGAPAGTQTKEEQWNTYQSRIKHLFTKALGDDNFTKAVKQAKGLTDLFSILGRANDKVGKEFAILAISDKKGYAKVPLTWGGGFAAHIEDKALLEDVYAKKIEKYGPQKPAAFGFETPATSNGQLDFLSGISATPAAQTTEEDDSDLPF